MKRLTYELGRKRVRINTVWQFLNNRHSKAK